MLQSDGFGPAYRDLARREPVFARLITVYGRPDPFEWHDGGRTGSSQFAAMLLHIVGQQISAVAAFAIYDRISAATGGILAPAGVLGLGQDRLRACGLSAARARYALALAEACRPAAGSARVPSRAMTEEQASKVLKAAGGQATGFVKVSKDKYAATHAATGSGELAVDAGALPAETAPRLRPRTITPVSAPRRCPTQRD
jgi:hypothetical protein